MTMRRGPALARRLAVRRYRYDQSTRTLVEPRDILTGLPTDTDHVGGRLAFGPDRKLYLTIGDQGSNFGANRCNANHAQDLPTAAQVRAKDWSQYQGKILRIELDGSIPADNPEIGGVRSHIFTVRSSQSARPRLWTWRPLVRIGARPELGR